MLTSGPVVADEGTVTLGQFAKTLDELIAELGEDATIAELTLDLDDVEPTYYLKPTTGYPVLVPETTASGGALAVTLTLLVNRGECAGTPVDWQLVRDYGSYVIEFCDHRTMVATASGDFHRRGTGSGSLGGYLQTLTFRCDVFPEYTALTNKARALFC